MANEKNKILDCECCGGVLVSNGGCLYKCDHCGYTKIIENEFSHELVSLVNHGNILRNKGEFDDASDVFRDVISIDENNSEGYWGLFLSDYGIMHVKDPLSKNYIPTCNRASTIPVDQDENYKKALKFATPEKREDLISKGEVLEMIRQKIISLSSNEQPYDVFICYKRTQGVSNGKESYTEDAIVARDIYDILTHEGYKVFFAEKTLAHLAGAEYEPLIYNALNTSKVMLVVCSDPNYITSPWVKNEWRRYLKQMEYDTSKKIIPVMCGGMKAGNLPDYLKKFQGLEMNVNFKDHLLNSISSCITIYQKSSIQRINVGDRKLAKKSNVIKDNVGVRNINNNFNNEIILSDGGRLKLAFNYISKSMFDDAEKEFAQLSHNSQLAKHIKFGRSYIKFKKRVTNEFDVAEFNDCIENSNEQLASTIFAMMKEDFAEQIKLLNDRRASYLYSAMMRWGFNGGEEVFRIANNFVRQYPSGRSWFVFNAIANCYDSENVDGYISTMNMYADCFLKNYSVYEARTALQKIIDVDEGDIKSRWRLFLASIGAINEESIKFCIKYLKKDKIKAFGEFLSYVPEEDRNIYVTALARGLVQGIKYCDVKERYSDVLFKNYVLNTLNSTSPKKLPLQAPSNKNNKYASKILSNKELFDIKDEILACQERTNNIDDNFPKDQKLFSEIKYTTLMEKFDEIIKYYRASEKDELIQMLYMIAKAFQKRGDFATATKYYMIILAENKAEHKAYWNLMLCDFKCTDNEELVKTTHDLSLNENYNRAIETAGAYDEKHVENYLTIRKEQESKKKGTLKAIRKKKIKFWTIISIGIVIVGFIIGGIISCIKPPIVKLLNYDGTVVQVIEAVDGKVTPDLSKFTRPDDDYFKDYKLTGWTRGLSNISRNTEITATYSGTPIYYKLTIENKAGGYVGYSINGSIERKQSQSGISDWIYLDAGRTNTYMLQFGDVISLYDSQNNSLYQYDVYVDDEFKATLNTQNTNFTMGKEDKTIICICNLKGTSGGSTSPSAPADAIAIATSDDLQNITNNLSGTYKLANDIDLSGVDWTPIKNFQGKLFGEGFAIKNLNIAEVGPLNVNSVGLFGTCKDAKFYNLKLQDVNINLSKKATNVGGLVGVLSGDNCLISEVEVDGVVSVVNGESVGGLIGSLEISGTSTDSLSYSLHFNKIKGDVDVSASTNVGGLIGEISGNVYNSSCSITSSSNSGNITGGYAGGIVGYASGSFNLRFSKLSNSGVIKGGSYAAGGIAGHLDAEYKENSLISDCTNEGSVNGSSNVGGIVGYLYDCTITKCSNQASISGSTVGGVVGYASSSKLSYLTNEEASIGGSWSVGGVVGYLSSYCSISNCTNKATILCTGGNVGGVVGQIENYYNNMEIEKLYNYSDLIIADAPEQANFLNYGGIIGYVYGSGGSNYSVIIKNCGNYGEISIENGYNIGGIVGSFSGSKISFDKVEVTKNISGANCIGGLVGSLSGEIIVEDESSIVITGVISSLSGGTSIGTYYPY